ncbi:hypothetical protein [Rubinisphaera italica]|uniref:Tetratricopeptide repeat protein n=1 Tax=Rubinisphaera italica TaxID=2527969 RepID=A0A5C5XMX7_9PLAN|nr:hypothetical protein [Rubinisphaera italica]TWT63831.1 hypothetical protein Pan54_45900 [Rubinisphaera italica]
MLKLIPVLLLCTFTAAVWSDEPESIDQLKARIAELEQRLNSLEEAVAPVLNKIKLENIVAEQRQLARNRMQQDREVYTIEQLREIESLYQVANRNWRTEQAQQSLEALVEKYQKANRTGCAILYLGQITTGDEQKKYLQQAIDDFSDCFYGDGVQVGAYARLLLAAHLEQAGDSEAAEKLRVELQKLYPDAIDHQGNFLIDAF